MTYTKEEIKAELLKYKLPWIAKVWKKIGIPFIRISFLPVLVILVVFGIIYNSGAYGQNDWMWNFDKAVALFYILGFGFFTLVSHIAELITSNKLRKKLGLSHEEFKTLVAAYDITGM